MKGKYPQKPVIVKGYHNDILRPQTPVKLSLFGFVSRYFYLINKKGEEFDLPCQICIVSDDQGKLSKHEVPVIIIVNITYRN